MSINRVRIWLVRLTELVQMLLLIRVADRIIRDP